MSKELIFPRWCTCGRDTYDDTTFKIQSREIICPGCGRRIEPAYEEEARRIDADTKDRYRLAVMNEYHEAHGGIIMSDEVARRLYIDTGLVNEIVNELIAKGWLEAA